MKYKVLCTIFFANSILFSQSIAVTTIPFTLENNGIYFYCKVNGTDSLKFLFDTGANVTVINLSSEKIKLTGDEKQTNTGSNGQNEVDRSLGNTISFGAMTTTDFPITLIPYGTTDFDGVFGSNLMQEHVIEIDYTKKELRFYDPSGYQNDLAEYDKLRVHLVDDYPSIEGQIVVRNKKYKGYFGLDTGANDVLTLASPFSKRYNLDKKMPNIGKAVSQGSDGSVYENPMVLLPELGFGKKSFYRIPILLSASESGIDATTEMAGFFGNCFLKRFDTVIDFKNGFIYFRPNAYLYTDFN